MKKMLAAVLTTVMLLTGALPIFAESTTSVSSEAKDTKPAEDTDPSGKDTEETGEPEKSDSDIKDTEDKSNDEENTPSADDENTSKTDDGNSKKFTAADVKNYKSKYEVVRNIASNLRPGCVIRFNSEERDYIVGNEIVLEEGDFEEKAMAFLGFLEKFYELKDKTVRREIDQSRTAYDNRRRKLIDNSQHFIDEGRADITVYLVTTDLRGSIATINLVDSQLLSLCLNKNSTPSTSPSLAGDSYGYKFADLNDAKELRAYLKNAALNGVDGLCDPIPTEDTKRSSQYKVRKPYTSENAKDSSFLLDTLEFDVTPDESFAGTIFEDIATLGTSVHIKIDGIYENSDFPYGAFFIYIKGDKDDKTLLYGNTDGSWSEKQNSTITARSNGRLEGDKRIWYVGTDTYRTYSKYNGVRHQGSVMFTGDGTNGKIENVYLRVGGEIGLLYKKSTGLYNYTEFRPTNRIAARNISYKRYSAEGFLSDAYADYLSMPAVLGAVDEKLKVPSRRKEVDPAIRRVLEEDYDEKIKKEQEEKAEAADKTNPEEWAVPLKYTDKRGQNYDFKVDFIANAKMPAVDSDYAPKWYKNLGNNTTITIVGITQFCDDEERDSYPLVCLKGKKGELWFDLSSAGILNARNTKENNPAIIETQYSSLTSFKNFVKKTNKYEERVSMGIQLQYTDENRTELSRMDVEIGGELVTIDASEINSIMGGHTVYEDWIY